MNLIRGTSFRYLSAGVTQCRNVWKQQVIACQHLCVAPVAEKTDSCDCIAVYYASAVTSNERISNSMEESSRHVPGAAFVIEEASCPNVSQHLEQTDQKRPYSDEKEKRKLEKNGGLRPGKKWPQYLAASLATLGTFCSGTVSGWTSPALSYLHKEPCNSNAIDKYNYTVIGSSSSAMPILVFLGENGTETEGVTTTEESWIGSLAPLGALVGALPAGYLANLMGPKILILLLTVPYLLGWFLIIMAGKSAPLIYIARFISGIALGMGSVITPIYCEEIAEVRIRGTLGVLFDLQVGNGILFVYVVGAYVSYLWLCIACAVIPVVSFLTFIWMPESPIYLASKGKKLETEKSVRWLRGAGHITDYDVKPELERIHNFVLQTKKELSSQRTYRTVTTQILFMMKEIPKCLFTLSTSPTKRALNIVASLMIFRQLNGINAVIFYTVSIFKETGGTISPSLATIIVGISQVVATYISSLLVERTGRRVLLLFSNVSMAVCHVTLAVHFYFKQIEGNVEIFGWLPLLCVATFIAGFNIGFGPLPWVMMAELIPNESKSWASGLVVSMNWILVFAVTNLYGLMIENLGPIVTFGIFGGMCTFGTVVVAIVVPETKGKTREEIQIELRRL